MSDLRLVVLVVEDDESTRHSLTRLIATDPRLVVLQAADGLEALRILESRAVDAVISDEVMPRINGLRLLETIRSRWPATRRVLFTGHHRSNDLVMNAINRGGVHKVLAKGIPTDVLRSEIGEVIDDCFEQRIDTDSTPPPPIPLSESGDRERVLIVADELSVRAAIAHALGQFSVATTGVQSLEEKLEESFAAIVLDLSNPTTDAKQVLKHIRVTSPDCPPIVLVPRTEIDTAHDALRWGAYRYLVHPIDRRALTGVVEKAIRWQRLAMLRRQAANSVVEREELAACFERALDEIFVVYQPIVRWSDQSVYGYEALVRSREPSLPHPGALFDAATKLDRIIDVGLAVRRVAPQPFLERGDHPLLFVNLHLKDVHCPDLLDSPLADISDRVVLEITERASFDTVEDLAARVIQLRARGYRIAIDDLGAGYAGLSAMADLDPDIVKIDMSLTRAIHRSNTKRRLVAGLQETCTALNLPMIAEGVETPEERAALTDGGVDYFQGYLFARPSEELGDIHWG